MSSQVAQLCSVIIKERFGNTPTDLVVALSKGPLPLPLIARELAPTRKLQKVRRALASLVNMDLVSFKLGDGNRVVYKLEYQMILNLLKIPRVCMILFGCYGTLADAIFMEFIRHGKQTYSKCIPAATKGGINKIPELREIFHKLIDIHLLRRCPDVVSDAYDCPLFEQTEDPYGIPPCFFADEIEQFLDPPKVSGGKRKHDGVTAPDANILWTIDWDRVDRMLRDYMVRETIVNCNVTDYACKATAFAFLSFNQTRCDLRAFSSSPTAVNEIVRATKETYPDLDRYSIERALKLLHDDTRGIIRKSGESAGGLYVVDYERAVALSCELQIESYIREKFGDRAVRIFKLLNEKGFLEEEQIEKMVMMSAKEARELTYELVDAGLVNVRHISKTNDFAPARTFYLYNVNMQNVVSHMSNTTAKFIHNIVERRLHGAKRHIRLLEQSQKLEEVFRKIEADSSLSAEEKQEQQSDARESFMSKSDMEFLDKYESALKTACLIEVLQVDTFVMFEQYLEFAKRRC